MKRTLWVVLLLSACSSPRGTEYARGTAVAPPPAPVRPGVGAPVVGQPGASVSAPRSPHKRYLPPQKEAGVWAGDVRSGPRTATPLVAGVTLPFPESATSDADKVQAAACAETINAAMAGTTLLERLLALERPKRSCAVANIYFQCMAGMMRIQEDTKSSGVRFDAATYRRHAETYNAAVLFVREACRIGLTEEEKAIWIDVVVAWKRRWGIAPNY